MSSDVGACPMMNGFDPAAKGTVDDPWEGFRRSREDTPVFFMPEHQMWVISRYADVRAALKDTETFSSVGHIAFPEVPESHRHELAAFPASIQLNAMDPPQHTPLRRLAQKAFTPRSAEAREPDLRTHANGLIDGFVADGEVDLADRYAAIFPLYTIAAILGIHPDEEVAAELRQWATDAIRLSVEKVPEEELGPIADRAVKFDRFIEDLIASRRETPGDDLVSMLLAARSEDGGEALTQIELKAVVTQSLVGGIDTSGGLIARMVYTLLLQPELWQRVAADPSAHAAEIVEETLRMYGAIRSVGRTTTRDVEVAGTTIPKGSFVVLHTGAADRDGEVFEDAEEFKIDRPMGELSQQLGLGRGTHFCLGAPFARVAGRVAIEVLAERIPDLKLEPSATDTVNQNLFVVVLESLPVAWEAKQPAEVG